MFRNDHNRLDSYPVPHCMYSNKMFNSTVLFIIFTQSIDLNKVHMNT